MAPGKANSSKSIWLEDKMLSGGEVFKFLFSSACKTFNLNKFYVGESCNGETCNQFYNV